MSLRNDGCYLYRIGLRRKSEHLNLGSSECDGSKVRNRSIVEYMKKTCHVRIPQIVGDMTHTRLQEWTTQLVPGESMRFYENPYETYFAYSCYILLPGFVQCASLILKEKRFQEIQGISGFVYQKEMALHYSETHLQHTLSA